jgi:hypothetical protein
MPLQYNHATTGPSDTNTNDSWPIMGGFGAAPGETYRFTVGDGPPQETRVDENGFWDWTPQEALSNGEHEITWERLGPNGEVIEESEWEWDIEADQATREHDAERARVWREGGRQRYLGDPNNAPTPDKETAFMAQSPFYGGGGGGTPLTAAGAGGAAALTGSAEKGNAQPQVEKGNA